MVAVLPAESPQAAEARPQPPGRRLRVASVRATQVAFSRSADGCGGNDDGEQPDGRCADSRCGAAAGGECYPARGSAPSLTQRMRPRRPPPGQPLSRLLWRWQDAACARRWYGWLPACTSVSSAASTRPAATAAKSGPVAWTIKPATKTPMPAVSSTRLSQVPAAAATTGELTA